MIDFLKYRVLGCKRRTFIDYTTPKTDVAYEMDKQMDEVLTTFVHDTNKVKHMFGKKSEKRYYQRINKHKFIKNGKKN